MCAASILSKYRSVRLFCMHSIKHYSWIYFVSHYAPKLREGGDFHGSDSWWLRPNFVVQSGILFSKKIIIASCWLHFVRILRGGLIFYQMWAVNVSKIKVEFGKYRLTVRNFKYWSRAWKSVTRMLLSGPSGSKATLWLLNARRSTLVNQPIIIVLWLSYSNKWMSIRVQSNVGLSQRLKRSHSIARSSQLLCFPDF